MMRAPLFEVRLTTAYYRDIVEGKLNKSGLDCADIPLFIKDNSVVWPCIRCHTDTLSVLVDGVNF